MPINSSQSPESAIRKRTPRTIDDVIQRPSEPEEESRFLTSRKNKWGIGAAAAVIGIHLVAGLGFLWPVVAAATYGATALLTPPEKPKEIPLPTPEDRIKELKTVLHAQLRRVVENTSEPIGNKFLALSSQLEWLLCHWDRLTHSESTQSAIAMMIQHHIPDVFDAYFEVINRDSQEHINELIQTLDILEGEALRIRYAAEENSVAALRERSLAVKLQYGVMPIVEDYDG